MYLCLRVQAVYCHNKTKKERGVFIKFKLALLDSGREALRPRGSRSRQQNSVCVWYSEGTCPGLGLEGAVVLSSEEQQHITQLHLLKLNNFVTFFFLLRADLLSVSWVGWLASSKLEVCGDAVEVGELLLASSGSWFWSPCSICRAGKGHYQCGHNKLQRMHLTAVPLGALPSVLTCRISFYSTVNLKNHSDQKNATWFVK